MTRDELAAIRARLDAATTGPWAANHEMDQTGEWAAADILVPSQHLAALGYGLPPGPKELYPLGCQSVLSVGDELAALFVREESGRFVVTEEVEA